MHTQAVECPAIMRVNAELYSSRKEGSQVNRVTIFAGRSQYGFHAMDQLTLKHENGSFYSINAKDVDKGMQLQLDGKFRRVVRITA